MNPLRRIFARRQSSTNVRRLIARMRRDPLVFAGLPDRIESLGTLSEERHRRYKIALQQVDTSTRERLARLETAICRMNPAIAVQALHDPNFVRATTLDDVVRTALIQSRALIPKEPEPDA